MTYKLRKLMFLNTANKSKETNNKMLSNKLLNVISNRGFKNFGHKRQPQSRFTTLWHGFLTFSFIGMGIEWKRVAYFLYGEKGDSMKSPFD